jgi:hypothetical protein
LYREAIARSGLSIYDPIKVGDPRLWIPAPELETMLGAALEGLDLKGLPLRTRSKVVKQRVAEALGYPVPQSFKKTKPRFPGQNFDTYIQKANNLQIWNEELAPTRRYVVIRVSDNYRVSAVKVVTGDDLAKLDTTGTLTQKYQARVVPGDLPAELLTSHDSSRLRIERGGRPKESLLRDPTDHPNSESLLTIGEIFERIRPLIGRRVVYTGSDQERNRAAGVHRLVCEALGYAVYHDDGRFPDVRHQLLEVKLQTSPTIDLGLVTPDSKEPLDIPMMAGQQIRHCDVRYGIFCGQVEGPEVRLTNLYLTTGEAFFSRFRRFEGKVLNKKLQIPLPADFFG